MGALLEHCCLVAQVRRMGLLTIRKAAFLDNRHAIKFFQNEGRRPSRSFVQHVEGEVEGQGTRGNHGGRRPTARALAADSLPSARARYPSASVCRSARQRLPRMCEAACPVSWSRGRPADRRNARERAASRNPKSATSAA